MTPDPTPSDLARLREIAEKATQGTWSRSGSRSDLFDGHRPVNGHQVYRENDQIGIAHVYYDKRTGEGLSDANHIAAFDPPTCLGLIDALSSERTARQDAEARVKALEATGQALSDTLLAYGFPVSAEHWKNSSGAMSVQARGLHLIAERFRAALRQPTGEEAGHG